MKQRAFSLIELLAVMAIIGIVTALTLPAFSTIGRAQALSSAGSALLDQLASARQVAVAQNRVVEVRIYKRREDPTRPVDATANPARFRSYRTVIYSDPVRDKTDPTKFVVTNNWTALTAMQDLPTRVVVSEDEKFSNLIYPYTTTVPSRDYVGAGLTEDLSENETKVPYQFIRFKATGGTDLGASGPTATETKWFLSIKSDNDIALNTRPARNYFTLMLDPISGRARSYRP